jgi:hypothetical protein
VENVFNHLMVGRFKRLTKGCVHHISGDELNPATGCDHAHATPTTQQGQKAWSVPTGYAHNGWTALAQEGFQLTIREGSGFSL